MRWTPSWVKKEEWHMWFAWYPVYLEDQNKYVWLERVLRRVSGNWWGDDKWYRLPGSKP